MAYGRNALNDAFNNISAILQANLWQRDQQRRAQEAEEQRRMREGQSASNLYKAITGGMNTLNNAPDNSIGGVPGGSLFNAGSSPSPSRGVQGYDTPDLNLFRQPANMSTGQAARSGYDLFNPVNSTPVSANSALDILRQGNMANAAVSPAAVQPGGADDTASGGWMNTVKSALSSARDALNRAWYGPDTPKGSLYTDPGYQYTPPEVDGNLTGMARIARMAELGDPASINYLNGAIKAMTTPNEYKFMTAGNGLYRIDPRSGEASLVSEFPQNRSIGERNYFDQKTGNYYGQHYDKYTGEDIGEPWVTDTLDARARRSGSGAAGTLAQRTIVDENGFSRNVLFNNKTGEIIEEGIDPKDMNRFYAESKDVENEAFVDAARNAYFAGDPAYRAILKATAKSLVKPSREWNFPVFGKSGAEIDAQYEMNMQNWDALNLALYRYAPKLANSQWVRERLPLYQNNGVPPLTKKDLQDNPEFNVFLQYVDSQADSF